MSATASKVISAAEAELGYKEKKTNSSLDSKTANAGSGNYTKYARDLAAAGYYNGNKNGYEWCDVFVDWCFFKAFGAAEGQRIQCQTGPLGAGTLYSMNYYKAKDRFDGSPRVGDQVFFRYSGDTGADHTGIVTEVSAKSITTIEGNSSDQVREKSYDRSYYAILGYGHPLYDEEEEQKSVTLSPIAMPTLRKGSIGAEVKTLQRLLKQLGYKDENGAVLSIDGDFGPATDYAVRRWQKAKLNGADGIFGVKSWTKLLKG